MKDIITLQGNKIGPTSVVMVGVHGDEKCGVSALGLILPNLVIETGTVHFIYGNPRALDQNKRFTEFNLNRAFCEFEKYSEEERSTYEYKRAQEIRKYLDQSTALLDIHSTIKPSKPFLFCEENCFDLISEFPKDFETIVTGVNDVEPGGSDGYMVEHNKIGICVECGQHEDPHVIDLAKRTIQSFLCARGHITNNLVVSIKSGRNFVKLKNSYYTKTNLFTLDRNFEDFEILKKNTLIGIDGDEKVYAPYDGVIVFARNCKNKNLEGFLYGINII